MVSRRGAAGRKQVPEPVILEEPPLVVNCLCCRCDASFAPGNVAGGYLDRRCPSCGAVLAEEGYDEAAHRALDDAASLSASLDPLHYQERRWEKWIARFRWRPFRPIRRVFERKLKSVRSETGAVQRRIGARRNRVRALAKSRYYTGEWYQRTHIPLERTVVAPYAVRVSYGSDGEWHINFTDKITSGMVAEFQVFQKLLSRVRDPDSILCGAQVVPNVYLPHAQRGNRAEKLWSQIDCIVLTRQAAFVLEVKRRRKHIVVLGRFEDIYATSSADALANYREGRLQRLSASEDFTNEGYALNQNSKHAIAFDEACVFYPFERIYEQVVYVGVRSFETELAGFADNVNVSSCTSEGAAFIDVIESVCAGLDDVISQHDLDGLGEKLVAAYGDLNQKRGQLHAQRLRNLRQEG